jgi:hypothetical protein
MGHQRIGGFRHPARIRRPVLGPAGTKVTHEWGAGPYLWPGAGTGLGIQGSTGLRLGGRGVSRCAGWAVGWRDA